MTGRRRTGPFAAVFAATGVWSFGGVLAKSAGTSGLATTFWRLWMASALLIVIAAERSQMPTRAELRRSILAGILFAANLALFFTALESISVASALVIASLTPVGMLPIATRLLGERLTPTKVACALVAVAAAIVAVLASPRPASGSRSTVTGYVFVTLAVITWLGYLTIAKKLRSGIRTLPFMVSITVVAAIVMTPVMLLRGHGDRPTTGTGWIWIVLLALGPGIAGHGLVAWVQDKIDASVTAVLMQAEPVGASVAAYVFLHERVSLAQGLAMAVVIVALCLLMLVESRPVPDGPNPVSLGVDATHP